MTKRYMTEYEAEMLEMRQELLQLKIEVRNAEKWVDYGKESIESLQNKIMDMEAKYGRE